MKLIQIISGVVLSSTTMSCTHITLLGHKSAYDVNAEFSSDPIAPVSMNAGFEGRSFAAVPPKNAVNWLSNFDQLKLPTSDVLSTILHLKIEKVTPPGAWNPQHNVPFDYVSSGATGLAATAAVSGSDATTAEGLESGHATTGNKVANETQKEIKKITSSGKDTFGDPQ